MPSSSAGLLLLAAAVVAHPPLPVAGRRLHRRRGAGELLDLELLRVAAALPAPRLHPAAVAEHRPGRGCACRRSCSSWSCWPWRRASTARSGCSAPDRPDGPPPCPRPGRPTAASRRPGRWGSAGRAPAGRTPRRSTNAAPTTTAQRIRCPGTDDTSSSARTRTIVSAAWPAGNVQPLSPGGRSTTSGRGRPTADLSSGLTAQTAPLTSSRSPASRHRRRSQQGERGGAGHHGQGHQVGRSRDGGPDVVRRPPSGTTSCRSSQSSPGSGSTADTATASADSASAATAATTTKRSPPRGAARHVSPAAPPAPGTARGRPAPPALTRRGRSFSRS